MVAKKVVVTAAVALVGAARVAGQVAEETVVAVMVEEMVAKLEARVDSWVEETVAGAKVVVPASTSQFAKQPLLTPAGSTLGLHAWNQ